MASALTVNEKLARLSQQLSRRQTAPEQVADLLRELILGGTFKSGDRIVEFKLARQLGVGQPTVREALKTLIEEGLVVREHNRGCSVLKLSPKEINQIMRLRAQLEMLAVELCIETWADWKREVLLKALERMNAAAQENKAENYYRRDLEFHQTIWRLAENPFLEKALWQVTLPYISFFVVQVVSHGVFDLKSGPEEHEHMARAILSGNKRHAREVTRQALERFRRWGIEVLAKMGNQEFAVNARTRTRKRRVKSDR
jgi:DNA-binding GntR family transcriptional regulator